MGRSVNFFSTIRVIKIQMKRLMEYMESHHIRQLVMYEIQILCKKCVWRVILFVCHHFPSAVKLVVTFHLEKYLFTSI